MSLLKRATPVLGTLYLLYLASRPPPLRWLGVACLAVVLPLIAGWLLGNLAGIGPWAEE
jgi:hypothetical protein